MAVETGLLLLGFRAHRLAPQGGTLRSLPVEAPTATLVEVLRATLESSDAVLTVLPAACCLPAATTTATRLESARRLLGTQRIGVRATTLPPLAGAVLGSLAAAIAPRFGSAGSLLAALPGLERYLRPVTWLRSVAELRHPAPSLRQHARSWAPGSAFAVAGHPRPQVHHLGRAGQGAALQPVPDPCALAMAAADEDGAAWLRDAGRRLAPRAPVLVTPPTPLGAAWWGTRHLAESVAYPLAVDALAEQLRSAQDLRSCRSCGEEIAAEVCPFCREHQPSASALVPQGAAP